MQPALRPEQPAETLGDMAYERIKEKILHCEFEPGSGLSEAQLAQLLGLGKAPIRRALSRLAQDGYVRSLPRRGYIVTPITLRDVHQLFEVRLLLEPAAARAAAGKIDAERLRSLEAICQAAYRPGDRESEKAFLAANTDFHIAIVDSAGNQRLTRIVQQLLEEMTRLFHLGLAMRDRTSEMQDEHSLLIQALASGDGNEAERVMREQIEASRRMVLDGILSSANFQALEIQR
jgi:DNA-binding GntR family transcriptional regulator